MRLLVGLVVLGGLLFGADRVTAAVVEGEVAKRVQSEFRLAERPDVTIEGIPFVTQAVAGDYRLVRLTVHDVTGEGVPVDRVEVRLHHVRVPLGDALARKVDRVRADSASATVVVTYAALNDRLADRGVLVSRGEDGRLRLHGQVTVAGVTARATATASVRVERGALVLSAGQASLEGLDRTVDLGGQLDARVPLPPLPFGVRLLGVRAGADGLEITAAAQDLVVNVGAALDGNRAHAAAVADS